MTQLAIRLLSPLLMVCLLTAAPLQAQNPAVPASLDGLDGFVEQVMKNWHVPGLAVAIVKDGQVVYAKGFGYRDASLGAQASLPASSRAAPKPAGMPASHGKFAYRAWNARSVEFISIPV